MNWTMPYPPPWQDKAMLCAHLCISDGTVDAWVKDGIIPPGEMKRGKLVWEWARVDRWMRGDKDDNHGMVPDQGLAAKVYHATKKAAANG